MDTVNTIEIANGETGSIRTKIIFNYSIARELIRMGFRVVDIKRNRDNNEVIFVLEDSLEMRDALQDIVKRRRVERRKRLDEAALTSDEAVDEKEPIMMED